MTAFTLVGTLPIKADHATGLAALIDRLQPDSHDIVEVRDGALHIRIKEANVPDGFVVAALGALRDFATCHACAASTFDVNGTRTEFGPDEAACRQVRRARVAQQIAVLNEELQELDRLDGQTSAH